MKKRQGFTLVELLVVIAMIGMLVAMLLPAVQAARSAARRLGCQNNAQQLLIAAHNYETAHTYYPQGVVSKALMVVEKEGEFHHSWVIPLLPYVEERNAHKSVDKKVSVYHPNNVKVRSISIRVLNCPSAPMAEGRSSYAAVHNDVEAPIQASNNGVFFLNSAIRYEDIQDGSTHTIFFGEKIVDQGDLGWMSGTRATLRNMGTPINAGLPAAGVPTFRPSSEAWPPKRQTTFATKVGGFGSSHPQGAIFGFGDGHVSFISESISMDVYRALGNRADGQLIKKNW